MVKIISKKLGKADSLLLKNPFKISFIKLKKKNRVDDEKK